MGQALPGVGVFALPNGWHAIALGPYPDEAAARAALRELRASRRIPGDSYVAAAADYVRRLDPSGSGAPPPAAAPPPVAVAPEPVESLAQARAAETRLSRDERQDIQRALTWFGHYEGGIDAAFGRERGARLPVGRPAPGSPGPGSCAGPSGPRCWPPGRPSATAWVWKR
ncbi:MAG: hypothetical protein JKP98_25010 [Rhodobacteraceae bacterium]|nr:hypothetical protein [Paracoccaceae bacterium]